MSIYREHHKVPLNLDSFSGLPPSDIQFKSYSESKCVKFYLEDTQLHAEFSYFIGADWIPGYEKNKHIEVQSKLNKNFEHNETEIVQIDVLKMLFESLSEKETLNFTEDLIEIKFDKPPIELNKSNDILSPLMIIQFLMVVSDIVRKGLKKGYYRTEKNLHARVKGKVLVSKTIKNNAFKSKNLHTICSFEEFGTNILENRLLKKAISFSQTYLRNIQSQSYSKQVQQTLNYIQPAFSDVSDDIDLREIRHIKFNAFYKDYKQAINLAKLILRRFGYNIRNTETKETISTPPFWLDMSKLFELYVLKLLKESYGNRIKYHVSTYGNELDYLLVNGKDSIIIDAKYKTKYKSKLDHQDMRQVSGYSRLRKIYDVLELDINDPVVLNCLIIYPDQSLPDNCIVDINAAEQINEYVNINKLGVKMPVLNKLSINSQTI